MDPPNARFSSEEATFTVPNITDRKKLESMDQRTFAHQIRELNPDLSVSVFTNSILRLDSSEQVRAGFSIREHTTEVEGAQEKVYIDLLELFSIHSLGNLLIPTNLS